MRANHVISYHIINISLKFILSLSCSKPRVAPNFILSLSSLRFLLVQDPVLLGLGAISRAKKKICSELNQVE